MSIGYRLPVKWPSSIAPKTCEFSRDRNDDVRQSSRSRAETVMVMGRPLWSCKLTWERIESVDGTRLRQIIEGLKGSQMAIQMYDFTRLIPMGSAKALNGALATEAGPLSWSSRAQRMVNWRTAATNGINWSWAHGSGLVAAATSVGAYAVPLAGFNQSDVVGRSGDYIQIDNRLYTLADDFTTDAAGAGTAYLMTPLIKPATTTTTVCFKFAGCEMRAVNQKQAWSKSAGDAFTNFSLELLETSRDF